MLSPELFTSMTIGIYFLASVAGFAGMFSRRGTWRQAGCWLALAAFFCQTFFLVLGFHKFFPTGLSGGAYLQMMAWFFLLCGLCAWWRMRQDFLILLATPFCLILFLLSAPLLNLAIQLPESLSTPFFTLHVGALFLSLGLLFLAFMAGLLFIFLQKRLKSRKALRGMWQDLPALSLLDRINSVCALLAFPLYTLGLVAGLFWSRPVFGSALNGDPKELSSLLVWLLLAILFHNRLAKGWNGRKPALLAVAIFLICIFSIFVVNLFLSTHHSFFRN